MASLKVILLHSQNLLPKIDNTCRSSPETSRPKIWPKNNLCPTHSRGEKMARGSALAPQAMYGYGVILSRYITACCIKENNGALPWHINWQWQKINIISELGSKANNKILSLVQHLFLMVQKPYFQIISGPSTVVSRLSPTFHHPVARYYQANRIGSHCSSYGLTCPLRPTPGSNFSICCSLTDFKPLVDLLPDPFPKSSTTEDPGAHFWGAFRFQRTNIVEINREPLCEGMMWTFSFHNFNIDIQFNIMTLIFLQLNPMKTRLTKLNIPHTNWWLYSQVTKLTHPLKTS